MNTKLTCLGGQFKGRLSHAGAASENAFSAASVNLFTRSNCRRGCTPMYSPTFTI